MVGLKSSAAHSEEETLLAIILLIKPSPQIKFDFSPYFTMTTSIGDCSDPGQPMLHPTILEDFLHLIWSCGLIALSPLLGCWGCKCLGSLWGMLVLLLAVLLSQLFDCVPCNGAWPVVVSLPFEVIPFSISPFPGWCPFCPCPSLHGLGIKVFWDIWGLSDSLSSCVALGFRWVLSHTGLPSGELADSLAGAGEALPLLMFPACWPWSLQGLDTPAALFRDGIFLTAPLLPYLTQNLRKLN